MTVTGDGDGYFTEFESAGFITEPRGCGESYDFLRKEKNRYIRRLAGR